MNLYMVMTAETQRLEALRSAAALYISGHERVECDTVRCAYICSAMRDLSKRRKCPFLD